MSISVANALRSHRSFVALSGFGITFLLVAFTLITATFGSGPSEQVLTNRLDSPSIAHAMGTDQLGRDQLSRVAAGVRNSLATALVVVLISGIGGGLIGIVSGLIGGKTDLLVQRLVDTVMALPMIVLLLSVVAATGASFWSVTLVIAVAFSPIMIRVTRAPVLSLKSSGFVSAARVSGASTPRIVLRHLVPNVVGPWALVAASQAGAAVLAESVLAFIGVVPGRITLGGLLGGEAQTYMFSAPWLIIWPGVVLALLSLSSNLIGEWISGRASLRTGSQRRVS